MKNLFIINFYILLFFFKFSPLQNNYLAYNINNFNINKKFLHNFKEFKKRKTKKKKYFISKKIKCKEHLVP